jgi:hypothetical protein
LLEHGAPSLHPLAAFADVLDKQQRVIEYLRIDTHTARPSIAKDAGIYGVTTGTTMWQAAQWICALVALSCGATPGVAVIQSAYDREAAAGSTLHDKSLQVLQAKCRDDGTDKYLCDVTFISKSDPTELQFFDIVAVARVADGWQLKSGLCKH